MIKIKKAKASDTDLLALLGRVTFRESHGHFINDKNDLSNYLNKSYSISRIKQDLNDPKNLFHIMYVNNLPVGYTKLVINAEHEGITSLNICRLERIYILNDFIPLKIGQQFLSFIEKEAKKLQLDTIWLTVYIKNFRAIRFYERNEFKAVGAINFPVNNTTYKNLVLSKQI